MVLRWRRRHPMDADDDPSLRLPVPGHHSAPIVDALVGLHGEVENGH
jgi:hypothetical protein